MAKKKNLVSIGLPVYNGEKFIRQALDSLLAQDYAHFELIISDNASTDATPVICREYLAFDKRIQFHGNKENRGARHNFRKVLSLATGKYFLWAADHDLWHPAHISRCVEILDGDDEVALCYPRALRIDAQGNPLGLATNRLDTRGLPPTERYLRIIWDLSGGDPIYGVMRAEAMKKVDITTLWAGDQARLAELSLAGAFAHIPEPLFYWRQIRDESLEFRKKTVPLIIDPVGGHRLIDKELPELWREFGEECLAIIERSSLSQSDKLMLEAETKKCLTTRYQVDWSREREPEAGPALRAKKSANVLLTTSAAPSQTPFSTTEKRPPIGIGFLISVLREAGHKVFFIDNYLSPSNFLETDYLQKNKIDFVGIYANTICYRDTRRMLHRLEYHRQTGQWRGKIIVGGPHASVALDTIPSFVDYVVQGEGEQAILDIVEGRVTERVVKCGRIQNLDDLPMPAWDYFIHQPYHWGGDWFPGTPVFTMNTSRGCPFHCTFCSVGSIWGRKYTCFSAERVVADIEYLIQTYDAQGIYFREDNFTVNRKRTEQFCHLLLDKDIKIAWACETRVDSLDRDLVALMRRAGLVAVYFGVESGSQAVLDLLGKGITLEQTRSAFRWCQELGVKTAASVIVGTPGETPQDLQQTLALLEEIKPTVTWYNVFVGIPKSPLYHQALENNLHEFIDDRGLVYLKGHDQRVKRFYGDQWDAAIPIAKIAQGEIDAPQISVVMSVYNGAPYLEEAINSILQQTYANFEFIIVNDASTDKTSEILRKFDDCRLRVLTNPENLGLTKSLNLGLNAARGQYIARMDADDLSLPHRLEKQLEFLEKNSEYSLVGSSYYQIDEAGSIKSLIRVLTDDRDLRTGLLQQNWFGHGSVMMRKAAVVQAGGYDESFTYAQDYDLWLRLAKQHKIANLEEPLYCWRATASCISRSKNKKQEYFAGLARKKAIGRETRQDDGGRGDVTSDFPLVSVIVPTYNRPDMLVATLQSILNQTYKWFEILVVNDCGLDVENIVGWLNQQGNITYVKHAPNRGLAAARNTGLKLARGKYIAYLDDDDLFYPHHLETLVTALEGSEYRVAYTDALRAHQVKQNGRYVTVERDLPYSHDFDRDRLLVTNQFPVLCLMHEKACLEKAGLFDETLTTHEDWDLWIRLSFHDRFLHIKKVTCEFSWREDGSTMTSAKTADFLRTIEIIHAKYQPHLHNKPHVREVQRRFLQEHRKAMGAPYPDAPEKASLQAESLDSSAARSQEFTHGPMPGNDTARSPRPDKAQPGQRSDPDRVPVSIIIPVFNNLELTQNCLESIWQHTPGHLYELIVVDNGSQDATATFLEPLAAAGRIRLIANETNLGYAKASNQGARAARGDFLVMLNNDTLVTPGWLEALLESVAGDDQVAAAGAKLLYPDDSVQHAGVVFNQAGQVYHLYRDFYRDHPAVNKTREFQVVTAACLLIRTSVFFQAGLFDENFQNCFEDVDLCLRVRQLGSRILYNPASVVYHLESKTLGRFDRILENSRYFVKKWRDRIVPDDFTYYQEDGLRLEWTVNPEGQREAVIHDENENPFKKEARSHLTRGEVDKALTLYDLALRFNPFDPRNKSLIAEVEALKSLAAPRTQAARA
jgi:O-antigen biosynthesis protein